MQIGESKKIRGVQILKVEDGYVVGEETLDLDGVCALLDQQTTTGIDYKKHVFLLVRPPQDGHGMRTLKSRRIKDRNEHTNLLKEARRKGLYVFYSTVVKLGGKYYANAPTILDWDSVPQIEETAVVSGELNCPFCGKKCTSKSGLTLHRRIHT